MRADPFFPAYAEDTPHLSENGFRERQPDLRPPPTWAEARQLLPVPYWEGHDDAIACWWRAWELGWSNFLVPAAGSGFVSPFVDTAFNGHLFLWDSVFICQFARYASQIADAQGTLDNFYAKQHRDGFICREINGQDGFDRFHRHDPVSTGPNVLAWSEWEHWLDRGDRARLGQVFAPLVSYHRWWRQYRSWPDGSLWSSGWGCGMDNQPRIDGDSNVCFHHSWMGWIDATAQHLLSAKRLVAIAEVLGRVREISDIDDEISRLTSLLNDGMWNESLGCYADRKRDGRISDVLSIGAYWTLLAGAAPPERQRRMVALLRDERHFLRPHALPSLSASHPDYDPDGGYWRGGVWPPTTYMVLRALGELGEGEIAHQLGLNHHRMVVEVFRNTGTLWENYAPESASPGRPAKGDFVGWGGLGPISVFLEQVLGLRSDVPGRRLVWDCRLTEAHGVSRYPFGVDGLVDLRVGSRETAADEPCIEAAATVPITLEVRWIGGMREIRLG